MAVDVIIDPSSGQIYWNDQAGAGTQTIAISGNATNAINIVGYSNFFSPGGGGLGTQILATFTDSPTSTFTPGTNAYDLGSSSLRWNFYGTGGNFTGAISTSSTTDSTSSTTGALIVSGGAGIAKTSYFGQSVVIQGSTASTGFSTGALVVTGGVGIGGSLYTGTTTRSSISGVNFNNSRAENGFTINASSSYTFNIQDGANNQRLNYHADSNRTEFTGNNATHEIRLIHSNNSGYTGFKSNSSGTVTYTLPAGDGSNGQVLYTNGSAGLAWTTPGAAGGGSSGVQAGAQYEVAFYTATGSSVAGSSTFKNDTAAAKVTITHTTASTSTTTGALVISGGVGIAGSIWSGQHIVTDTTVSSSTSTGAMLVFGGLGVSGQVNAASLQTSGNAIISGNLTFNGVGVFGNATSDTINSLARYISDILPSTDNSYDLGNNSLGWRNFRVSGVGTIASLQVTSVTAGVWGGTAISAVNGGTGQVSYTIGDILYASSTTALSKLAAGTAGSVLASGGVGAAPSWVLASSGGGAGTVASGTANQVAYYASTGASVSGAANLTYNTTSVIVANTTASNNNSSGALLVYGGIGASGQISGAGASFTSTVYLNGIQIGQGGNNINILDSSGATIANFNTSNGWFRSAQTTQSTSSATGSLVSLGGLGVAKAASIGETIYGYSTVASTGWSTGSLILSGGLGVSKTSYINGDLFVTSSTASTNTTSGALVVTGSVGIGGTLNVGTAITAFDPVGSIANFARNAPTGSAIVTIQNTSSNAVSMATLQFRDHLGAQAYIRFSNSVIFGSLVPNVLEITNQVSQIVYTAGSGSSSNHTFTGGSGVSIQQTNASTSSTTGALVVTGGVGVGGSLWTSTSNFSSISGVGHSNSAITSGVWSGTAISAVNGGTGQVSYAIGDILYASSTTALAKLSAGTAGSVLASGGAGAAPFWKVDATGAGGAPGGSNYQLQYNNASAFGGASRLLFNALLAEEFLITSPYQTSVNASLNIGLGTTSFDGVSLGRFTGSASGTVIAVNQASGFTGNFADFQLAGSSKFTIGYDGKITLVGVFSFPTTAGTAGSVLKSNGTGNQLYWAADSTGGGGGTVAAPSAAGLVAYYAGTGASVTSNPIVKIETASSTVEINSQNSKSALILNAANGSVSNLAEFKNSLGDVLWSFGAGAATLKATNGGVLQIDSASGIIIDSPAALTFFNTAQTFYTALTGATNASSDLTFILPTAAGTAGSVLTTAGASGELYWSAPGAAGGGAGTVASGTANQVAVYAATGASVSGAANFTYNTTSVTIRNTTASNNNSSGALLVHGGIGASGQISGAGASFTSTVYLNGIQIGQGGNNINILDSSGATIANFNTSNGWFRSAQTTQSTSSATGSLVSLGGLGVAKAASIGETVYALSTVNSTSLTTGALVVSGGAGFAKTIFVGDNINIFKSGSVGALRLWNSAQTQYTAFQAGAPGANTTYTLPTAFPGSGTSVLASDTSGIMSWIASGGGSGTVTTLTAGNGITFSTGTTITTTGTIRRRTSYNLVFMSGYTPNVSGVDTVVLRVPDSAADAASVVYNCREVIMRVETAVAGTSTINIQKYGIATGTGTSLYSTTSTGSTTNILSAALSITGATTYEAASTTFAAGHGTCATGDKLRVNFTALNASHTSFTISLLIEEQ